MPHADQTTRHLRWTLGARGAIALSAYRPIGCHGDYQTLSNLQKQHWMKMMKMLSWIFLDTLNHNNLGSLRHCFFEGSVAEFRLFTGTVAGHSATSATSAMLAHKIPWTSPWFCYHRMLESVWINGYQHSLKVTIYIWKNRITQANARPSGGNLGQPGTRKAR